MPRCTGTSRFSTSANLIVLFWPDQIASLRSLPTLSASMSNAAENSMSPDVVAAEVHVHEPGDLLLGIGVAVVLHALHERVGAVADPDDGDAHLFGSVARCAVAVLSHRSS